MHWEQMGNACVIYMIAIDSVVKVASDNTSFLKSRFRILRSLRLIKNVLVNSGLLTRREI